MDYHYTIKKSSVLVTRILEKYYRMMITLELCVIKAWVGSVVPYTHKSFSTRVRKNFLYL